MARQWLPAETMTTFHGTQSMRSRRLSRRLLIVGTAAMVLSAGAVVFGGPRVLRHVAEQQLGRWLGRTVAIERLRVNPFALSLTVDGLEVLETDGRTRLLSVRRLYVNTEVASLFQHALIVKELRVESPRVRIERRQAPAGAWTGAAVYNFSDIVTRLAAASNRSGSDVALPRFSLNNIRIMDGALVFDDPPLRDRHEITSFTLGVPFLSTLPVDVDTFVAPGMSGRIDGRPFAIEGRSKLFKDTIESVVQIRVNALDLTRYLPYVPVSLPVAVSSARLTVALDVAFVRPRAGAPRISLSGKVELAGVSVREPGLGAGPLIDLRDLAVVVRDADFTSRRFVIDQVLVSGLEVHARRLKGGRLDLVRLLPGALGPAPARATSAVWTVETPPRWSVGEIRIEASALAFRDETIQPPFEATAEDISASVAQLSNAPGSESTIEAAFVAAPGGKVVGHGRLGLDPLASTGTVSVEGIEPGRFAPYYQTQVAFGARKGLLSLGASYELAVRPDHVTLHLREGFVTVQDLALRRPGARTDFLRLPQLAARDIDLDIDGRAVSVGTVSSRSGRLAITRDGRGIVDLTTLAGISSSPAGGRASASPWAVSVGRLDLESWSVPLEDRAVSPPVVLAVAPLSLHATSLSTTPGRQGRVDARLGLDKKGRLSLAGAVSLEPPGADLRAKLRAIDVVPLQSYWRDQLNLIATSGRVSFDGRVRVEMSSEGAGLLPNARSPEPRVLLTGDAVITNLTAIDAEQRQELFRWRALRLDGIRLATPPVSLAVREVALADFGAQLIVFSDGRFNFGQALGRPTKASTTPAAKTALSSAAPPKISIGKVTLDGGRVRFADWLIRPHTSIDLTELTARVAGLSSGAGTRAEVDLRGRLDRSAPLTVAGRVNPLAKDLFVDLRGVVQDYDLTAASAYSVKYLGYGIRKGKLSLDLAYHVGERKLDARNHIVVAGLRFGDKVPSPDASKLPVKLAVALLQDRHGVIDVSLPVSGGLDDPGFAFWSRTGKALRNRVLGAATSAPFSLIAKAFGGPEELSRVEFAAGLASLDPRSAGKLQTLAKALEERPEPAFEIQGGVDPGRDREELRRDLFERKLKVQKRAELSRQGMTARALDDVRIDPSERSRLLAAAYEAETFAKPRNFFGLAKRLPPDEMERLMMANLQVGDGDLRALAVRRASAVKDALGKLAPSAAGRLLVVNPFLSGGTSVELKLRTE